MYLFVLTMKKNIHDTDNQPKTHILAWCPGITPKFYDSSQLNTSSPCVPRRERLCVKQWIQSPRKLPPAPLILGGGCSSIQTKWKAVYLTQRLGPHLLCVGPFFAVLYPIVNIWETTGVEAREQSQESHIKAKKKYYSLSLLTLDQPQEGERRQIVPILQRKPLSLMLKK